MWRSTKEENGEWLETKEHEFSRNQNKNPRIRSDKWLQRYVFSYLHEIFFVNFSNVLAEWMQRLAEKNITFRFVFSRSWTLESIQQVNTINNQISCVVDFWLDSVLGGYINEFSIDCTRSYNVVERELFKSLCGRYLKSLSTWIKMLLCDKGVMQMEYDCPSS
jgi:hypothetical protein